MSKACYDSVDHTKLGYLNMLPDRDGLVTFFAKTLLVTLPDRDGFNCTEVIKFLLDKNNTNEELIQLREQIQKKPEFYLGLDSSINEKFYSSHKS